MLGSGGPDTDVGLIGKYGRFAPIYVADVGHISANMADLSRYAAGVGLTSAISVNMADKCRYSAEVVSAISIFCRSRLGVVISANLADLSRYSADVGLIMAISTDIIMADLLVD